MRAKDWAIAPLYEGALILVMGLVGWAAHQPLVFASLGPTAYELVETPERESARPYNIIAGHWIAIVMAFVALTVTHAWSTPAVSATVVPLTRVWAGTLAAVLTVLVTLLARARQPAATSTTLLIALGMMQRWQDGLLIGGAILLITAIGEPLRRQRMRGRR